LVDKSVIRILNGGIIVLTFVLNSCKTSNLSEIITRFFKRKYMDQKVWLITGAGRGMGVDIVKAALSAGDKVVATGRNINNVATGNWKSRKPFSYKAGCYQRSRCRGCC
jgi:3-oxoacyl-ACP reductase-like protein